MSSLFRSIRTVVTRSLTGSGLLVQIAAIVTTAALVFSGIDWQWYEATRNPHLIGVVVFAGLAGFIIPILAPLALLIIGSVRKDEKSIKMARMLVVAEFVAFSIAAAYKALTGRLQPNLADGVDISHAFQFGFLKHGIFWGWPSSHTIVAFAAAVSLALAMRSTWLRVAAIMYACVVGLGASIGFHWLSDVVAGALVGTVVAAAAYREANTTE